jgi:hypothetical protein
MFRYQNLTTNSKWLTDLVLNAAIVLGGLAGSGRSRLRNENGPPGKAG